MAEYAARSMKEKCYREVIKNTKERLNNYTNKLVTKYVPSILLTEKAKEYLEISLGISFSCEDFTIRVYSLEYPRLKTISIPRSECEKLRELKKKYDEACCQSMNFYKKCINTILEFRTVAQLGKAFPEAVQFLPKEEVATPDENIASLKQILKT